MTTPAALTVAARAAGLMASCLKICEVEMDRFGRAISASDME